MNKMNKIRRFLEKETNKIYSKTSHWDRFSQELKNTFDPFYKKNFYPEPIGGVKKYEFLNWKIIDKKYNKEAYLFHLLDMDKTPLLIVEVSINPNFRNRKDIIDIKIIC